MVRTRRQQSARTIAREVARSHQVMTRDEWLNYGYEQRYCSAPVCDLHDDAPRTIAELNRLEDCQDECIYVVRIYDSTDIADIVITEQKVSRS